MDWTPTVAFFASTGALQLAIAVLLLAKSRKDTTTVILGTIFGVNGMLALLSGSQWLLPEYPALATAFYATSVNWFEPAINFLIGYLALVYPKPISAFRKRRWLGPTILGSVLLVYFIPLLFEPQVRSPYETGTQVWVQAHVTFFWLLKEAAFPLLLLRWALLLPTIKNPAQLRQFKFLFAAFGVRAAHMIGTWGTHRISAGLEAANWDNFSEGIPLVGVIRMATSFAAIATLVMVVAHLFNQRTRSPTDNQHAIQFVLYFLGFGVLEAILDTLVLQKLAGSLINQPLAHIDVLVLRPILVYAAVMRHQFLGFNLRGPIPLQILAFALALPALYAGAEPLMTGTADSALELSIAASMAAVVGSVLVSVGVRPLGTANTAGGGSQSDAQAESDYLAAVEDMYRRGAQTSTERGKMDLLRSRLGISHDRAEALEGIVQGFWGRMNELVDWHIGDRVLGRYRIDEILGRGAMSHTYLCHDELRDGQVVLKRQLNLDESSASAIHQEGRTLANLNHPNIVRLLRTESIGDESVLVLEYMDGGSLEEQILARTLPQKQLVRYVRSLLMALEQAHGHGVIHRDIKPSNILFDSSGTCKLADFGIAQQTAPKDTLVMITAGGTRLMGSFRYMAPEQIDLGQTSQLSDLFSLGAVILDCVTASAVRGEKTARREAGTEPRSAVKAAIKDAPKDLQPLLESLLNPDPKKRVQSAGKALAMLD